MNGLETHIATAYEFQYTKQYTLETRGKASDTRIGGRLLRSLNLPVALAADVRGHALKSSIESRTESSAKYELERNSSLNEGRFGNSMKHKKRAHASGKTR